jgi:hypothetical protein
MRKFIALATLASGLSLSIASAQAGGWGGYNGYNSHNTYASQKGHNSNSSGLVNVSPSVNTGNISVLSGILNQSPILSGNSILSGNNAGLGILGSGTGLLNNVLGSHNRGGGKKRR